MPTFTTVALDTLIEPGGSNTMAAGKYVSDHKPDSRNATSSKIERVGSLPSSKSNSALNVPKPRMERRNSASATDINGKRQFNRISPALYTTPETTPLPVVPDSPSSFPPSPYIINHKRRGPRLLKSSSQDDVAARVQDVGKEKAAVDSKNEEKEEVDTDMDAEFTFNVPIPNEFDHEKDVSDGGLGNSELKNGLDLQNGPIKPVAVNERMDSSDDFFDPQDSMSVKSNASNGGEQPFSRATPSEFYDAWEELSPDSAQNQLPLNEVESELREIRSSLLMETEKRKQVEESLNNMQSHWLRIRQQLSTVGLTLPADPVGVMEDGNVDDPVEALCQQVNLARYVSSSIGKGIAKAEAEAEMESQMEAKNFEISRLWDRLNYYEAVNREMSQRNQEVVENARSLRQRRKKKLRWVWGSVAAAITVGTAALAWSYAPSGKGISSSNQSDAPRSSKS
ncbi:uncharacterized protein LOC141717813 [Apium graveolens]|uniref:uncharacterized protein LOC141717813 n=1 Tax=Apium graveolens TaxID=4045 RepID=UPI003D7B9B3C